MRACGLHRVCTGHKKSKQQSHTCAPVVCTGFHRVQKIKTAEPYLRACGSHRVCTGFVQGTKNQNSRAILARLWFVQGLYKAPKIKTAEPFLSDCGLHRASRQIKTASKGIIRKECQSFTKYGHDKTPPTVFNPLSLWLTLPLNMGVSHTLWPPSITRAILARLWFAQGTKNQNSRSIHTAASFICKAYMHMALKKCHLPVSTLQKYLRGTCFFKNDFFKWTYDY